MNSYDQKPALLLFAALLCGNAFAVTPSIQWQKSFGGSDLDHAKCIHQTADGGSIICGYTRSNDGNVTGNHGSPVQQDAWVIRLDAAGNLLWQKTLGGSENDELTAITQSPDGGFVAVGFTRSVDGDVTVNHGLSDWWIVKFTASGTIIWQKTYGGTGDETANSVEMTSDGGLIITGFTESSNGDVSMNHGGRDYWAMKLSNTGIYNNNYWRAGRQHGRNSFISQPM